MPTERETKIVTGVTNYETSFGGKEEATQAYTVVRRGADDEANTVRA